MKHLKRFLEYADFDVSATDLPDVKVAKEKMTTIQKQLTEYKTKKLIIDKLYAEVKEPEKIEAGLQNILGKQDIQNGIDRNPFLVEYVHLAKLKSDLDNMSQQNVDDKVKLDDFQQELRGATDDAMRKSIGAKITEINNRMGQRVRDIQKVQNELQTSFKEHNDKMTKMGGEMKDYISKISS